VAGWLNLAFVQKKFKRFQQDGVTSRARLSGSPPDRPWIYCEALAIASVSALREQRVGDGGVGTLMAGASGGTVFATQSQLLRFPARRIDLNQAIE
jgi:hypothetical protein